MGENLKTPKYNDGNTISLVADNTASGNLTSGGYCWYNNDDTYKNIYGALYNWYAVNTGKLCPTGWHVPTDGEWQVLEKYLGMTNEQANAYGSRGTTEGGKLKETGTIHWYSPNVGATNESGFTALPGGSRLADGTSANTLLSHGLWWSSTGYDTSNALYRYLNFNISTIPRYATDKKVGMSVRCIKDN